MYSLAFRFCYGFQLRLGYGLIQYKWKQKTTVWTAIFDLSINAVSRDAVNVNVYVFEVVWYDSKTYYSMFVITLITYMLPSCDMHLICTKVQQCSLLKNWRIIWRARGAYDLLRATLEQSKITT